MTNKDARDRALDESTPLQKFNALWYSIEKHMGVDPECAHWADDIRAALTAPVSENTEVSSINESAISDSRKSRQTENDVNREVVELLDCWKDYSFLREDVAQEKYPDIRSSTDKTLEKLQSIIDQNGGG